MLPNRSFRPGWNLGLGYSYQQNNLTTIQELSPNAMSLASDSSRITGYSEV